MEFDEILFTEDEIEKRVDELAKQLNEEYKDKDPLFISVLNGSFLFCADLIRKLDFPIELEFIKASSYGTKTESDGNVTLDEIKLDVKDRDLIIIEDMMDSGYTLETVIDHFKREGAKSITTVVLLDKPSRRQVQLEPDLCGFHVEDKFVIGYGFDYAGKGRNLPYITTLKQPD